MSTPFVTELNKRNQRSEKPKSFKVTYTREYTTTDQQTDTSTEDTNEEGPVEYIRASDAFPDGEFFVFVDPEGLIAARRTESIVSVDRMS